MSQPLTPGADPDRVDERAGTAPPDEVGAQASPRTGTGPEPDLDSPGAAGRAEPGVPPPPDTNQAGTEPMPPQGDRVDAHPAQEPVAAGSGGTVGSADPQAPGRPLGAVVPPGEAGPRSTAGAGSTQAGPGQPGMPLAEARPEVDATASTSAAGDGEVPRSATSGSSSRVPGVQGEPPEPSLETDTEAGAARMAARGPDSAAPEQQEPGDAHGVSVGTTETMAGTSEEADIVQGVRTPPPAGAPLTGGAGRHAARESGPGPGQGGIVGRPSAPDGEVGSV